LPFPQSLLSPAIQLLIDRIFDQDAISSPQRIDKRDHMISFPSVAARALPLDRRADHPKSLRNERFIRRVHVKFANPHLCIQNDERRHPGSPGRLPA
ncbi:hypothetical protein, partial [Burkholderia cenocepacia]|uniref:hypothetical protein n=1 Tax=Burkholderia cenocepacia TaxID=95486 RepID=UPI002AB69288